MAEIKEMKTEDIVKDVYNSMIAALEKALQSTGQLKENIIEAKHLTQDIDAVTKGFNADKLDGKHASEIETATFLWALVGGPE